MVGEPFTAIVDGKEYESKTGFVKTGENKQVWKIITKEGFEVRATDNHKILTEDREWVELKDLDIGTVIALNNNKEKEWFIDEKSNKFAKGWLMGSLYGDGTYYYYFDDDDKTDDEDDDKLMMMMTKLMMQKLMMVTFMMMTKMMMLMIIPLMNVTKLTIMNMMTKTDDYKTDDDDIDDDDKLMIMIT